MKTLKIANGEIRIGYELSDLPAEIQDKIISDQINFEIEVMSEDSPYYELAIEMERLQTPWFLASEIYNTDKQGIIESININEYLFDENGEMLPIIIHTGKNGETLKTTFGKNEHLVDFI